MELSRRAIYQTLTKDNDIRLNEMLASMKKSTQSLEEYVKKFKSIRDKFAINEKAF